jgi:hypothetical protein
VADGQIDVLRLTIAAIAMRVTNDPDWLEEMPPDTKEFVRRVFSAAVLLNGAEPTDVTVH